MPLTTGALYPDPWITIATTVTAQTMPHLLRQSERLLRNNPLLERAYRRVIAFLITKIVIKDCSDEEKKKYQELLLERVKIIPAMHAAAFDYLSVGNSFLSLQTPFTRYLRCKNCSNWQAPLDEVDYKFENFKFYAKCPVCHKNGEWARYEIYNQDQKRMKVRRWSPHEMEIKLVETTGERIYYWRLNETIKALIKKGDKDYLKTTPWVEVECVRDNSWLKFNENQIIHLYMEPPAGWRTGGWGIPDCLQLFPELYNLQVCRRHNEGVIHESIIPFKFISPKPVSKIGVPGAPNILDPSVATNLSGNFVGALQSAISRRRRDPYGIHVLPHGIEYQQVGGDAKNLITKDIMDQNIDFVLNAAGVPVDFYKASFSNQGAALALRCVQSSWSHLTDSLERMLDFVMEHASKILQIEPAKAYLAKPSDTDDINRMMAKLNLMSGGQISETTGLDSIGLDDDEERDRKIYAQIQDAKKQKEMQKTLEREGLTDMLNQGMAPAPAGQQQGQQGQPQQQGGPPPLTANPQLPKTPTDMTAEASAWSDYLIKLKPANQQAYSQYLLKLRQEDPVLHQLVMGMMEDKRNQINQQGGQMLLQQQAQGG